MEDNSFSKSNFVFLRASKEELSDMIGQEQFNDLKDMELSNTTVYVTDTVSPFLGVIDDCILELEESQKKIFLREMKKNDSGGNRSFDHFAVGSSGIDPFEDNYDDIRNQSPIIRKEKGNFLEIPKEKNIFQNVDFTQDFEKMENYGKNENFKNSEKNFLEKNNLLNTPKGHTNSSNESFNLIQKIPTSKKKFSKNQNSQKFNRKKNFENFSSEKKKIKNFQLIFEENKQLRVLMSDYLREIDQLRYAYTKLRRKYTKSKEKNSTLELEIKRLSEINKLLKNENFFKKSQIFQNFCFYPKKEENKKKIFEGEKIYKEKKNFGKLLKKKKKSLNRIEKNLKNEKFQKSDIKKTSLQTSKIQDLNPSKSNSQISNFKKNSIFENLSHKEKILWMREKNRKTGSLNLNFLKKKNFLVNEEKLSFDNFYEKKPKKKFNENIRNFISGRENVLKNLKNVKKLKKKILKDKNEKLRKRLAEGGRNFSQDSLRVEVKKFHF